VAVIGHGILHSFVGTLVAEDGKGDRGVIPSAWPLSSANHLRVLYT
jgi:hypothetical protein